MRTIRSVLKKEMPSAKSERREVRTIRQSSWFQLLRR
jgi:hypothetical protein